jgi:hypothetical protein
MSTDSPTDGARDPPRTEVIEVRVSTIGQLFKAIDPSPFRTRDLRTDVEEFIVGWAREADRDVPLALRVHLDGPPSTADTVNDLGEAVHSFFRDRAQGAHRRLQRQLRVGRTSLLIGLACLVIAAGLSDVIGRWLGGSRFGPLLHESLLIGGWVAMWRPLEIFLYDWWPIRADEHLFARLSAMPVRLQYPEPEAT